MNESVALAKDVDAKKASSSTYESDERIHRARNESERQLGSLGAVIDSIKCDGAVPSVESIATQMSGMHTAQRAPALLALQQTHGNRYVQRVVAGIQAKLVVGQPEDKYEQEADRVADAVVRMPEPQVQRQPEEEEEEELQAKELPGQTSEVTPNLESRINVIRGGGQPLSESTRAFFEPRFGYDFSQVQVHTGTDADTLNHALNARAFTVGQDIFFRQGAYDPGSSSDQKLMAHELTHVVQQNGAQVQHKLVIGQPGDIYEHEADRVAEQVSSMQHQAENDGLAPTPNVPLYLQSVLTEGRGNIAQYKLALQTFRREYSNDILDRYRSKLGEPDHLIEITQTSPLKQIRCMGRGPSEREEALERLPGDDEFVIDVCTFFFPSSPPAEVNPQLRQLASEMLWEATEASRAMDLVPRPPGGRPGPAWLVTQGVKIAWRRAQDRGYYNAVRVTVARNYRSVYEMAKMGMDI